MATRVYLADLRYNSSGVLANDAMPLGIAYMKSVMDRDLPEVESQVFAYPDRLLAALRTTPPDVLMFTNYVWNESLGHFLAARVKEMRPETLIVMGGPNLPLEPERQIAYLRAHPELDIYALGEGDFLATELVRRFLDAGKSIERMADKDLPSCVYRRGGEVLRQPIWDRHKELNDLPSPWLTGVQDKFFDGRLAPMIETNRGCPFTCTFCVEGTRYHTKVHNFSKERVREEIMYIGRRIRELSPEIRAIYITDSNYGMFERDVEISEWLGEARKLYGWPTFIDATTGKNRPDRVIRSLEKTSGALVLYQAVQSLDERVLKNIKRQNIKLQAYEQLRIHLSGRGMRSGSDLILGLPGESLQSHLHAIEQLIDTGVVQMHNFQAMMLRGSEMEMEQSRAEFQFQTRFRGLPRNHAEFEGRRVLETEEIVIATADLPYEDYLTARKYHLVCSVFWSEGRFESAADFAGKFGVKRWEWLRAMLPAMENSRGPVRQLLDDFVGETKDELFPSREACVEFYTQPGNFERLANGEIGDNLIYKYRSLSNFAYWPEICETAMRGTLEMLIAKGALDEVPDLEHFWSDYRKYVELRHTSGTTAKDILQPARGTFAYDIDSWVQAGMPTNPLPFRLPVPQEFEFRLTEESEEELRAALSVWPTTTRGLARILLRLRTCWQIRQAVRCVPDVDFPAMATIETSQMLDGSAAQSDD